MDINEQIANNLGIVYKQLGRFKLTNSPDAESMAYEALYNAILTYREDSGNTFATYAVCVVSNALRTYLRTTNRKRQLTMVSYYEPIKHGDEDSGYLLDTMRQVEDTESLAITRELQGVVGVAWRKVFDSLIPSQKPIVLMWYQSDFKAKQQQIAAALNVSQATVSKTISAFKHKLKLELEEYL